MSRYPELIGSKMNPSISFIICTYNSPNLVSRCINSIIHQNYKGKTEILLVDGGSDKPTLELLKNFKKHHKNITLLENKNRYPEGSGNGKWLGYKKAKGEFIAFVDQDNEIQRKNWINNILVPFTNKKVFGVLSRMITQEQDSLTNQYVSLVGTDPFFAYRSLDFLLNFNKENSKDYFVYTINKDNLLITGGNCFIYKKSFLDKIGGYIQDTENVSRLVNLGYNTLAISNSATTHHSAISGFLEFLSKKKKWAGVYSPKGKEKNQFSYLPRTKKERKFLILNLFSTFLIFPNILVSFFQLIKTRKLAWILHPVLSFYTGVIYLLFTAPKMLKLQV